MTYETKKLSERWTIRARAGRTILAMAILLSTEEKAMAQKTAHKDQADTNLAPPRCVDLAGAGIKTSTDFANVMSAMMTDLIESRITPQVGNAVCNAGGKLLKIVEMTYKYGVEGKSGNRQLSLAQNHEK